jgi:hypothetical protein
LNPLQQAALNYIHHGWSVIPLQPRGKRPHFPLLPITLDETGHGRPKRTWEPYQTRLPTEEEVIQWWQVCPTANIGIVTGTLSGIIVLDLDGLEPPAELPRTLTSRTGKGMHIFFRHPGGRVRNFSRPGMDLKGDGGYVVAPPSIHPSGALYEWQTDLPPADPPNWLMDLILPPARVPPSLSTRWTAYGRAALRDELRTLASTQVGMRNNQLNKSAFSLGQLLAAGVLDRDEVERRLTSVATAIGLGAREIQATLRSGLEAGMRNPRIGGVNENLNRV